MERSRSTPYVLIAVLVVGTGLGIGFGFLEAPPRYGWAASAISAEASLGPTSSATRYAKALLLTLNHGNLRETVPPQPCSVVRHGSFGPLKAPYRICATSTFVAHFVEFIALGRSPAHGMTYTDRPNATFLDECYMHLVGRWWAWQSADLSNPVAPCSAPWRFHGGP